MPPQRICDVMLATQRPEQISALIARLHAKCMERARKQAQLEIMEARLEKGREKGDFEKDKGAPKRYDDAPARP